MHLHAAPCVPASFLLLKLTNGERQGLEGKWVAEESDTVYHRGHANNTECHHISPQATLHSMNIET